MALFQNSVISKYLKTLDKYIVKSAYAKFSSHFHNPAIQENIRNSKEEQYQGEFLIDLFVNVLGYTKNPEPNFNLTTEFKNVKDSKKADGAIIINNVVKAVIELKGTNTTDLSKIEEQAFSYKNNQPECVFVVTSNFQKLRFYIDNAIEHIEFNLFDLTENEFEILYLCLAFDSIEKGIPKKIKEESLSREDVITKTLYNDYSLFKRTLHQNLVLLNPQFDTLTLFKKSQKLLDRFLFLFFAEDRHLLPPNSVKLILNDWRDLQERDVEIPLYDRFKKYFQYLNTGYKGKRYDVFAYNGGLFKPDEILDAVKIDDGILFKHTSKLSEYDFVSEVDVNILGHIFENSLNELDEIKAQLEGREIDKAKTKRKKDGVFYTPKYITKYIVDNTLGKLCSDKKAELQIIDEDYFADKKRPKKITQALAEKLTIYRNWLLKLTICDPACGSGAFLNQALDFLIAEHRYIDELQAKLFGDAMVLSDIENSILENNLFGVDINEESVEIAKLSLWLRTARPNRTLNDLNNNIKCGNSLIDDPEVAGDKAFNWYIEFPQVFPHYRKPKPIAATIEPEPGDRDFLDEVQEPLFSYKSGSKGFEKHGFDVVISNPPYVSVKILSNKDKIFFLNNYATAKGQFDLYVLFYEKGYRLLKSGGILSFISSNTFISNKDYFEFRKFILTNSNVIEILNLGETVFTEANLDVAILSFKKEKIKTSISIARNRQQFDAKDFILRNPENFINDGFEIKINIPECELSLIEKLNSNKVQLSEILELPRGIEFGSNSEKILNTPFEGSGKILFGKNIERYNIQFDNKYCFFENNISVFKNYSIYSNEKILIQRIRNLSLKRRIIAVYDDEKFLCTNTLRIGYLKCEGFDLKYILAIINSNAINFLFLKQFLNKDIYAYQLQQIPIPLISFDDQLPFIQKADLMLSLNKELQLLSQKFQRTIQRRFDIEELPAKLQNWYLLSFKDFIAGLAKKKIKLSLSLEAEWEEYFLEEAKKALGLKAAIEATDKEIDMMVYSLYGLTEEEINIIESF